MNVGRMCKGVMVSSPLLRVQNQQAFSFDEKSGSGSTPPCPWEVSPRDQMNLIGKQPSRHPVDILLLCYPNQDNTPKKTTHFSVRLSNKSLLFFTVTTHQREERKTRKQNGASKFTQTWGLRDSLMFQRARRREHSKSHVYSRTISLNLMLVSNSFGSPPSTRWD